MKKKSKKVSVRKKVKELGASPFMAEVERGMGADIHKDFKTVMSSRERFLTEQREKDRERRRKLMRSSQRLSISSSIYTRTIAEGQAVRSRALQSYQGSLLPSPKALDSLARESLMAADILMERNKQFDDESDYREKYLSKSDRDEF